MTLTMLIWYNGHVYTYQVLPNTNTDFNRFALESNFFPVIYNGEISEKMYLKVFTRRILVDEKIFIRVIHAEKT